MVCCQSKNNWSGLPLTSLYTADLFSMKNSPPGQELPASVGVSRIESVYDQAGYQCIILPLLSHCSACLKKQEGDFGTDYTVTESEMESFNQHIKMWWSVMKVLADES